MARLPPPDWPGLQVNLAPTVQQIFCRFNTVETWRAAKAKSALHAGQPLDAPQVCLVWRDQQICRYRSLEPAQTCALAGMVSTGWCFSELCERLAVSHGEGAPLQAVSWLKQWVQDGLLERRIP